VRCIARRKKAAIASVASGARRAMHGTRGNERYSKSASRRLVRLAWICRCQCQKDQQMTVFIQSVGVCIQVAHHIFYPLLRREALRQTEPHILRLAPRRPGMAPDETIYERETGTRIGLRTRVSSTRSTGPGDGSPAQAQQACARLLTNSGIYCAHAGARQCRDDRASDGDAQRGSARRRSGLPSAPSSARKGLEKAAAGPY
jgi:hypothetical protein